MHETHSYLEDCRPHFHEPSTADMCVRVSTVKAEQTNEDVMALFSRQRELVSLPVVEGRQPIGLINRNFFLSQMSKPFHKELYNRKSCIAFMDKEPLIVDLRTSIDALTLKTVEYGEKALTDGFIITEDGGYAGVGHGLQLMRVVADMQASRNRQIMHSIDYASVIQRSMLRTSHQALSQAGLDANLVWEPRDVVGGDFYRFSSHADGWLATVADCTGHGVPGAFMTLIASITLSNAVEEHGPRDPARLLASVNRSIKTMLGQIDGKDDSPGSNDGMDAACLWFDRATCQLRFAGARISLFVLHPGAAGVAMVDGERMGVGYVDSRFDQAWSNRELALEPGSIVFAATDGLIDQVGGPKAISFGKRRIRDLLLACRELPARELNLAVQNELRRWQGSQRRRDDLTFFCFRVQD